MTVFTMIGMIGIMQFGIFVFVKALEINLRGNLQGSKGDGDCIFYQNFFRFTKNFLPS